MDKEMLAVSVHSEYPGFLEWLHARGAGRKIDVYLDGELQEKVIYADVPTGVVLAYALDANGRVTLTPDRNEAATVRRRGVVKIVVREPDHG